MERFLCRRLNWVLNLPVPANPNLLIPLVTVPLPKSYNSGYNVSSKMVCAILKYETSTSMSAFGVNLKLMLSDFTTSNVPRSSKGLPVNTSANSSISASTGVHTVVISDMYTLS